MPLSLWAFPFRAYAMLPSITTSSQAIVIGVKEPLIVNPVPFSQYLRAEETGEP